jgi:hypothetical protein
MILLRRPSSFALCLLIALFAGATLLQGRALPLIEGSDEDLHYLYVEHLRASWTLPAREDPAISVLKQQSGQPPLTYLVAALAADLVGLPRLDDPATLYGQLGVAWNPWNTPLVDVQVRDNHNFYYQTGAPDAQIAGALSALRLTSLAWGIIAILGAYTAARTIFPRDMRWALLMTSVYAFTPTFVHSAAYLNNDISATALATWALALTLWATRHANARTTLLIGALVALGGLAKISALLIAPACVFGILYGAWQTARLRGVVAHSALFALPLLVLFAPWAAWGALQYGDPLGVNTHGRIGVGYTMPLTVEGFVAQLPNLYFSYLSRFGLSVYAPPLHYALLSLFVIVALGGVILAVRRGIWLKHLSPQTVVLLLAAGMVGAGVVRWMLLLPAIPGRLLLPAHQAIAVMIAFGLHALVARRHGWSFVVRCAVLAIFAFTGLVAPLVLITRAYTFTPGETSIPETLQGQPRDYDHAVRFLGYSTADMLTMTFTHRVTTCWEILSIPPREPAYTLKLIGENGIVSERTSLMGLGLFPRARWQVGDRWCEMIALPPGGVSLKASARYNLVLALLDIETFASDWQPTTLDGAPLDTQFLGELLTPEN